MHKLEKPDITKLLGFDTVATELMGQLDFRDETLGAKAGGVEPDRPALFRDDNFAAKLGAKVGDTEESAAR